MNRHSCGSKIKYKSAGAARHAMRRVIATGRTLGECAVYPCKGCGGWHWGRVRGTKFDRAAQTISAIDHALARDSKRATGGTP